jgi:hypothetical protein
MFGYMLGAFLASLLIPFLILIAAKFIGPLKRHPKVVYSVCGVLVIFVCSLGANSDNWPYLIIPAALALLVLWRGYRRDMKDAQSTEAA